MKEIAKNKKSAIQTKRNMKRVQQWRKCNTKKVQHENSSTWKKCNMKWVQHKKSATWKECNTRKVQHEKKESRKSAAWAKHSDKVIFQKNCTRRMHKNAKMDNGPSVK